MDEDAQNGGSESSASEIRSTSEEPMESVSSDAHEVHHSPVQSIKQEVVDESVKVKTFYFVWKKGCIVSLLIFFKFVIFSYFFGGNKNFSESFVLGFCSKNNVPALTH